MGHMIQDTNRMFRSVSYNVKTTAELREAMQRKITEIEALTQAREARTLQLRQEHDIDAEKLAVLVMRYQDDASFVSYDDQGAGSSGPPIPAGVIANLVREREMIDSEHEQIRKLELILRNIRDEEVYAEPKTGRLRSRLALHELSDRDLEYLGF